MPSWRRGIQLLGPNSLDPSRVGNTGVSLVLQATQVCSPGPASKGVVCKRRSKVSADWHHFPLSDPSRPGKPPRSAGAAGAVHRVSAHLLLCLLGPRRPPTPHPRPLAPLARRAEPGTPRRRAPLTPASPAPADAKVTRLPLPSWTCAHLSWRRTRRRPGFLGCPPPGARAPVTAARRPSPKPRLFPIGPAQRRHLSPKPLPQTSHAPFCTPLWGRVSIGAARALNNFPNSILRAAESPAPEELRL